MRISSATVTLAGVALTGDVGITGLSINGQHVAGVFGGVGASAVKVAGRGNSSMTIAFTAVRELASDSALEQFALSHFGTCPKSGALVFTVGAKTYTASTAALVALSIGEPFGLMLPVSYSITCAPLIENT